VPPSESGNAIESCTYRKCISYIVQGLLPRVSLKKIFSIHRFERKLSRQYKSMTSKATETPRYENNKKIALGNVIAY